MSEAPLKIIPEGLFALKNCFSIAAKEAAKKPKPAVNKLKLKRKPIQYLGSGFGTVRRIPTQLTKPIRTSNISAAFRESNHEPSAKRVKIDNASSSEQKSFFQNNSEENFVASGTHFVLVTIEAPLKATHAAKIILQAIDAESADVNLN